MFIYFLFLFLLSKTFVWNIVTYLSYTVGYVYIAKSETWISEAHISNIRVVFQYLLVYQYYACYSILIHVYQGRQPLNIIVLHYLQNVCLSAESSYLPAAAVNKLRVYSQAEATSRSYKCDVTSVIDCSQLES